MFEYLISALSPNTNNISFLTKFCNSFLIKNTKNFTNDIQGIYSSSIPPIKLVKYSKLFRIFCIHIRAPLCVRLVENLLQNKSHLMKIDMCSNLLKNRKVPMNKCFQVQTTSITAIYSAIII